MHVEEIPCELDPKVFSDADTRSPGLHLSNVTRPLGNALGMTDYGDNDPTDFTKDPLRTRVALGFIWENFIEAEMCRVSIRDSDGSIFRPPEIERDGIACSPDAFDINLPGIREYKCTSKSSRHGVDDDVKHWAWWTQIKSYCHVLEVDRCILQVMWLSSDYDKKDPGPEMKAYRSEFTERELKENWDMVVKYARSKGML